MYFFALYFITDELFKILNSDELNVSRSDRKRDKERERESKNV